MKIKNLLDIIEAHLPHGTAMEGDRIGLQIKTGGDNINNILLTMELNDYVVQEAISNKNDCIITFHPLIYNPLLQINQNDRVGRLTAALIKNDIALISAHTNFDAYVKGTSRLLCEKLELIYDEFLIPDQEYEAHGMGVICHSNSEISIYDLLDKLSDVCSSPVRYSMGRAETINTIGIVGGSGSSFIDTAMQKDLDCFITADISYHNFHRTAGRMALMDPGHYEMEQFVSRGLYDLLNDKLDDTVKLCISHSYTNPVRYYPQSNYTENQKKYIINKI